MIQYSDSQDFDPQQLLALFEQAEWARGRSLEEIQRMLAETDVTISAWDGTQIGGVWSCPDGLCLSSVDLGCYCRCELPRPRYWEKALSSGFSRIHRWPRVELFWLCTRRYQGFYASLGFSDKEQTGMVWDRRKQLSSVVTLAGDPHFFCHCCSH